MSVWVTNASPLIFLAKLGRLDLLNHSAGRVLVPSAVLTEIGQYDDAAASQVARATENWLHRRDVRQSRLLGLFQAELGAGEAATLALASEVRAARVVLDDLDGRRWARKLDLEVIGTLGLLLGAKLRGDVTSLRTSIDELKSHGFRASQLLIEAVLEQAGELTS